MINLVTKSEQLVDENRRESYPLFDPQRFLRRINSLSTINMLLKIDS